jgi:hypothetical protein
MARLNQTGAARMGGPLGYGVFPRLMAEGRVVHTERVTGTQALDIARHGEWEAVLKHQTIPFISYPYLASRIRDFVGD